MEKNITIYILAFNRPEFISEAIDSVLSQTYENYNLIISDNSTDSRIEHLVKNKYPNIEYIKRLKSLNSIEHQNILLKEIKTEYVVFFHDDDVMLPSFIEVLISLLSKNYSLAAAAPNAEILISGSNKKKYFHRIKNKTIISNGLLMAKKYFEFNSEGYPPFPGYMYRSSMLKDKFFDQDKAGRHSDFTFIESLLDEGAIAWLPDVLMQYRLHSQSSSVTEDLRARKKLINHLASKYNLEKYDDLLMAMNFKFIHSWLKKNKSNNKIKLIHKKLLFILLISNKDFWFDIIKKMPFFQKKR